MPHDNRSVTLASSMTKALSKSHDNLEYVVVSHVILSFISFPTRALTRMHLAYKNMARWRGSLSTPKIFSANAEKGHILTHNAKILHESPNPLCNYGNVILVIHRNPRKIGSEFLC